MQEVTKLIVILKTMAAKPDERKTETLEACVDIALELQTKMNAVLLSGQSVVSAVR
jgi:hypothetical protein